MIEKLYDILQTPKDVEEIQSRLLEMGINWNEHQVKLFLDMDRNVKVDKGLWCIENQDEKYLILRIIKELLRDRPIIPIMRIIESININGYDESRILKIAIDSGEYVSPNGKTLKKL